MLFIHPFGGGGLGNTTLSIYGQPLIAVSGNGIIAASRSNDFVIKIYNSTGAYLRTIRYAYKKARLSRKVLIQRHHNGFPGVLEKIKEMKLPKTWSALHSIKFDGQNRLWVSTIVENQDVYQWWVMNKKGKLLARFTWPRGKPIQAIKNNSLYVTVRSKKGIARIVRYTFTLHRNAE